MTERPVCWQDLAQLSRRERLAELGMPLPWLLLAVGLALSDCPIAAVLAVMPFFTAALRLSHDTFHGNLGLRRAQADRLLFVLSLLLGGALHAIEYTHLRHHRRCLADDDTEGRLAHHGFGAALLRSPAYPLLIHIETLRHGDARQRRWVRRELAGVGAVQALIWSSGSTALQILAVALIAANALVPMIGIWSVHRAGAAARRHPRWLQSLSFNMLYHDAHHRHPRVPARHLPELAQRLETARSRPPGRAPHGVAACRPLRRGVLVLGMALLLAGCNLRSAAHTQIDTCTLAADLITAQIPAPLATAEPGRGAVAGSCLFRARDDAQTAPQLQVHIYTAAAARRAEEPLARIWRITLAEARNTYGGSGDSSAFPRIDASAVFGFERGGSGQILLHERGVLLEIGTNRLDRERATTLARALWDALERLR